MLLSIWNFRQRLLELNRIRLESSRYHDVPFFRVTIQFISSDLEWAYSWLDSKGRGGEDGDNSSWGGWEWILEQTNKFWMSKKKSYQQE